MKPLHMAFAKTACLIVFSILTVQTSFAQHRTQLWGVAEKGGPQDVGYIFKYDIGSGSMTKVTWLNKPFTEPMYYTDVFKSDNNYLYAIKSQNDSVDKATIVRYNLTTGQLEKLYTFDPAWYNMVSGALTLYNGKYYGLAWGANRSQYESSGGAIFEYDPATNTVTNKYYFGSPTIGSNPRGQLLLYNNKFYGTTSHGGANNSGIFYEFDPATNVLAKKADFNAATSGHVPVGFLYLHGGKLYGACVNGGANNNGTLFEYNPATGALVKAFDFVDAQPLSGKMTLVNDKLYSPVFNAPMIMEFDLAQKTKTIHRPTLNNNNTAAYSSPLTLHNGTLYGVMLNHWKDFDSSVVYSWTPGSPSLTQIASFHLGDAGKFVRGPLTMANDKWYALTEYGSQYGRGSIVEIDPQAKSSAVKATFGSGIDGHSEFNYSSNLLMMNNRIYGSTEKGGLWNYGFIYSYDPSTQQTERIHDFKESEPSLPYGNLTSPGDRQFFGVTINGPNQAYGNSWYYYYLIPEKKFEFISQIGEFYPQNYYYGVPNPYMAYSHRLYKAVEAGNGQAAGIFMCYPGNTPPTDWTRVFTFPPNISPAGEKGQVEINHQMLGFGYFDDGGGRRLVVYKLDLVNYDFTYRFLGHVMANPVAFKGHPVELNNKYYALTGTGCFQAGSLIEWDNAADTVIQYCYEGRFTEGAISGSLTVADGKLYGYAEKAIVCFDPVAKTFKTAYKSPAPLLSYYLENNKKLTLAITNELPKISGLVNINICLDESLTRNLSFAATDADADILNVKAAYTDSVLIRNCKVQVDSSTASRQYSLQLEVANKVGNANITIIAADTYGGITELPLSLVVGSRPNVTLVNALDTICKKDTVIALGGGLPAGGVYYIDGVIADSLRPASLAEGNHTLKYVYPATGACRDSAGKVFYITECALPDPAAPGTLKPYPNPSPGQVKINNEEMLTTTVQVFNSQGFKVYTKVSADQIIELDLSGMQTGMYYITATNSKGTSTGKVEIVK